MCLDVLLGLNCIVITMQFRPIEFDKVSFAVGSIYLSRHGRCGTSSWYIIQQPEHAVRYCASRFAFA